MGTGYEYGVLSYGATAVGLGTKKSLPPPPFFILTEGKLVSERMYSDAGDLLPRTICSSVSVYLIG